MGKALPRGLRSKADFLLKEAAEKFSPDFEKNKAVLKELGIPFTKINRNLIAGYITRQMEKKQESA